MGRKEISIRDIMEYRLKDQVEGREKDQGERGNVTRDPIMRVGD